MPEAGRKAACSEADIRRLEAAVAGLRQRLHIEQRRRQDMRRTIWWRATAPLRFLSRRLRRLLINPSMDALALPSVAGRDASAARSRQTFKLELDARLAEFLAGSSRIVLPSCEAPAVSILLILYNQASFTLRCLQSIASTVPGDAEVIILDNGSTDETGQLLARVSGARVIRSEDNLYYLRGVNLGAGFASGRCLLLLNNDTELGHDSVARALDLLDSDSGIGALGGRLIRPNGRLQEAGNIVWQDGGCFSYGADQPPEIGSCMFQRDVDYVSGAFLMTRRELFERLGRFDEALAPAYYEETDYCLRLWQAGYRVVFDPRILVHHYEFASGSKEAATALMRRNQAILVDRHRPALRARHLPALPEYPLPARSRDWDRIVGRALVLTELLPSASGDGEQRRAVAIVRALEAANWFVTVHPLASDETGWEAIRASLAMTVEVMRGQDLTGLPEFLRDRAGYYDRALVIGASGWTRLGTDRASAAALAELGLICDAQGADLPAAAPPPEPKARIWAATETAAARWRALAGVPANVLGAAPPLDLPLTDPDWSGFVMKLGALLAAENAA